MRTSEGLATALSAAWSARPAQRQGTPPPPPTAPAVASAAAGAICRSSGRTGSEPRSPAVGGRAAPGPRFQRLRRGRSPLIAGAVSRAGSDVCERQSVHESQAAWYVLERALTAWEGLRKNKGGRGRERRASHELGADGWRSDRRTEPGVLLSSAVQWAGQSHLGGGSEKLTSVRGPGEKECRFRAVRIRRSSNRGLTVAGGRAPRVRGGAGGASRPPVRLDRRLSCPAPASAWCPPGSAPSCLPGPKRKARLLPQPWGAGGAGGAGQTTRSGAPGLPLCILAGRSG